MIKKLSRQVLFCIIIYIMFNMNFIHPPDSKAKTKHRKIEKLPPPAKVFLPLSQHTGAPSELIVKAGDTVKTGQVLAESTGFISSSLHASISGKVASVGKVLHPVIGFTKGVVLESDGQDNLSYESREKKVEDVSKEEIPEMIKSSGIVGLGGAAFPTYVKLLPPKGKKIDTLIINGAECEPFLTCDHRLMLEKAKEIIFGAYLISKALGVENILVGIEENKMDAIEAFGTALFKLKKLSERFKVVKLKTRYPQGGEKQLIYTLLKREVPSGGLPLDIGCVVDNVHTCYSVYEAVCLDKPLYERVVTVTGEFLKDPKNLLVRIGTPIKDLLDFCKIEYKSNIHKIIMGGPMTGVAQYTLDVPVVKGTSGVLVMSRKVTGEERECIRCSRCIDACPAGLMPCMIGTGAQKQRFDIAMSYNPKDCIECGSCSFVCPSKIPLTQLIKLAKLKTAAK